MLDALIVVAIVGGAAFFTLKRFWKTANGRGGSCGCGECACGTSEQNKTKGGLQTLDSLAPQKPR